MHGQYCVRDVLKCTFAFHCKGKWSESDCEVQLPLVKNPAGSWFNTVNLQPNSFENTVYLGIFLFFCFWLFVYKV